MGSGPRGSQHKAGRHTPRYYPAVLCECREQPRVANSQRTSRRNLALLRQLSKVIPETPISGALRQDHRKENIYHNGCSLLPILKHSFQEFQWQKRKLWVQNAYLI